MVNHFGIVRDGSVMADCVIRRYSRRLLDGGMRWTIHTFSKEADGGTFLAGRGIVRSVKFSRELYD